MGSQLPRNLAIAGVAVAGGVYFYSKAGGNPYNTFGSQNVANAYSRGGGSKTHAPGIATKLGSSGDSEDVHSPQTHAKGIDTEHFKEHQAQQKVGESGGGAPFGKTLNEATYGHKDGK